MLAEGAVRDHLTGPLREKVWAEVGGGVGYCSQIPPDQEFMGGGGSQTPPSSTRLYTDQGFKNADQLNLKQNPSTVKIKKNRAINADQTQSRTEFGFISKPKPSTVTLFSTVVYYRRGYVETEHRYVGKSNRGQITATLVRFIKRSWFVYPKLS